MTKRLKKALKKAKKSLKGIEAFELSLRRLGFK